MLYITGGKILTMAGRVYENGTIGIQNGKIAEIKEGSIHNAGCNCQKNIINVDGAWVMPGLIEAHCHVGISEEKKGMEGDDCNENVNPITPYLRAIDAINTMDAGFSDAVRAGITSAMIGPGSSNVVGGQFVFLKLFGRCIDDLIVKAPAAMKVAFGENPKVNYSGMGKSPSTRMAIAGMLREELFHAREYLKKKKENRNFEPDFRMEPWEAVFNGEIPLKAHVHRVDDIFTAVRIAKEFGLRMTLDHCSEGHLVAERLSQEGFPAIVGPDLSSRSKIEVQNVAFKTVGILQKAGMLTAITTDHPVSLIQSLPICAGMAVKAGLPMEEGLKAITINPAKICGVADRVGSLEVGKDADIAVFNGNPMEVFTKTLYTIIDGQVVYEADENRITCNKREKYIQ